MSKAYEELEDPEKLVNSIHLKGLTGQAMTVLLEAIQHQLDNLVLDVMVLVKQTFQPANSLGNDIEEVAKFFDIVRLSTDSDTDLRQRVLDFVNNYVVVTADAILDLFESLIGRRPLLVEAFYTRMFTSGGGEVGEETAGEFDLIFELPRDLKHEQVFVAEGGNHVVATDDSIVSPDTTSLSGSLNSTTTVVPVASVADFKDSGDIYIADEWIFHGSRNTSANQFEDCKRGVYETTPASHTDAVTVYEGVTRAFLAGNNTVIFDYQSGQNIYLEGGPYTPGTRVDIRYEVQPGEKYDTLDELVNVIDSLAEMGYDYKAAGVKADIGIGTVLRSWAQDNWDTFNIIDQWDTYIVEYDDEGYAGWQEELPLPDETMPHVMSPGNWDEGIWDIARWDVGTPGAGIYRLIISGS